MLAILNTASWHVFIKSACQLRTIIKRVYITNKVGWLILDILYVHCVICVRTQKQILFISYILFITHIIDIHLNSLLIHLMFIYEHIYMNINVNICNELIYVYEYTFMFACESFCVQFVPVQLILTSHSSSLLSSSSCNFIQKHKLISDIAGKPSAYKYLLFVLSW